MAKENQFHMRISEDDLDKLNIYAKKEGKTASQVIKEFISGLPELTVVEILKSKVKQTAEVSPGKFANDLENFHRHQAEMRKIDGIARDMKLTRIELIRLVLPLAKRLK